jgi:carbamoyltransferase
VDGTARVQTVSRADNALLHELLTEFDRLTSVPVLLNTSFNGPGEPIVETPVDALRTFLRRGLDVVALGRTIVVRRR